MYLLAGSVVLCNTTFVFQESNNEDKPKTKDMMKSAMNFALEMAKVSYVFPQCTLI